MSEREVSIALSNIYIRSHNTLVNQARLHDREMQPITRPVDRVAIKLTPEQEKQQEEIIKTGLEKIKRRFNKGR